MASGSKSLLKGIFVLLFIGAVFMGLTFLLEDAPEQTPITSTQSNTTNEAYSNDPAVVEARAMGAQIGTRIGEEVGRRVGEQLVAGLDDVPVQEDESVTADSGTSTDSSPVTTADATQDVEDAETESMDSDEQDTEGASEMQVAEVDATEDSTMSEPEQEAVDDEVISESAAVEPKASPSSSYTIADEPAIPAPEPARQVENEPDPSKNFVFSSSGWWNESANGKGLRIVHVGQAASATGINKSIVVILSDPIQEAQNLEQLIQVRAPDGSEVQGTWRRSANSRNLYMHTVTSGTYQVSFSETLASNDGKTLGMDLSGPVTIR